MNFADIPDADRSMPPDPRMAMTLAGFDKHTGQPLPMNPGALRRSADRWPTTTATPEDVAGLLRTSRDLYVASFYAYEFLTVGVLWSLLAVEAALRLRLDGKEMDTFKTLVDRAHKRGLLDDSAAEILDAGRELRNGFSHPDRQEVWSYGMAGPTIRTSHEVVTVLFSESEPQSQRAP